MNNFAETEEKINQFQKILKERQLSLKMIVALPRSNSTVLELVLGKSRTINKIIHEPFINYAYYNQLLVNDLDKLILDLSAIPVKSVVLIKEMSHWITKDNLHTFFLPLIDNPPLLIFRSPLHSVESKIRKILQSSITKDRIGLNTLLCEHLQLPAETSDKTPALLEKFARSYNYTDWSSMLDSAIQNQNYVYFEPILRYFNQNELSDFWGWKELEKTKRYLDEKHIEYILLEGTDFRVSPDATLKKICFLMGLAYTDDMLNLDPDNSIRRLGRGIIDQGGNDIWYNEALTQTTVSPPENRPPMNINNLPPSVADYITNIATPIYLGFVNDRRRFVVDHSTHQELFNEQQSLDPLYQQASLIYRQ